MEGLQQPKLSDEARNGFAAAVAGQPEGATETAVETEADPAGSSSPAPDTSTETEVVAAETEVTDPTKPAATGDEPSVEETKEGPIPYPRFREVNEAKKRLEEEVKAMRASGGADPAVLAQLVEAHARTQLSKIAAAHPELAKVIYGDQNPQTPDPAQAQANLDPKDPVHAKIMAIEAAQKAATAELSGFRRQAIIDDIQDRAETRIATHAIFKNEKALSIGETLIAQRLVNDPRQTVESVVDDVAKQVRDFVESTKAAYVQPKVAVTKKIAPGTGGGSAAPPGTPTGQKLAFGGSARKAFEGALRGDQQS